MKSLYQRSTRSLRSLTALAATLLLAVAAFAQPGGQSAGGSQIEGQQQERENQCLRLLEKTRAPETHHFQTPHHPLVVIGQEGTQLLVPADAFVHLDGTPVRGDVEIVLTEVTKKPDLILSNLPTISNGRMLVSGGVIHIEAIAEGKKLRLAPGKSVLVNFPGGYQEGMELFKGQYNTAGEMNWVPLADGPGSADKPMAKIGGTEDMAMPLFLDYGMVDPNTFQFANGTHSLNGYINAMMQTGYKCTGQDRVYLEMKVDDKGRVTSAKTLTGKNPCYRLAIEEVAQTVQFDMSRLTSPRDRLYLEVSPSLPVTGQPGENMFASIAGNADAFNNPQVLAAINEYMEKEKAENFTKYAFAVTDLGWINCDRFYDSKAPKVNAVASVKNQELAPNTKVFLVFEGINSVLEGTPNQQGQFSFANVPSGMKAKVVAISYEVGEGAFMNTTPVTIKEGNIAAVSMDRISEEDLRKTMASL